MGAQTIDGLIAAERLPRGYCETVEHWWRPLAAHLADRALANGGALAVGVNGAQGSGKTTACRFLALLLGELAGLRVAVLSLDDIYLTKAERARLAATVHPLLATRGVPGTHDLALGKETISQILAGSGEVAMPLFDKARDDRAPRSRWAVSRAPIDVLLFEGWCIGARPQAASELERPVNMLEAAEDPDGIWRRYANDALAQGYADLFARLDLLLMLRSPGFSQILEWRQLQERKLVEATGQGMTPCEVERFVMHYERLTRHMLEDVPARSDIVIDISAEHVPYAMTPPLNLAARRARTA